MANLKALVTTFLGNYAKLNKAATEITLAAVKHWQEHNDWTQLARLVANVDTRMGKRMKLIIRTCVPGAVLNKDDKAEFGLKFGKKGDAPFDQEKIDQLTAIIADKTVNYNIHGDVVDAWAGVTKPEKKDPVLTDWAANAAKKAIKEGWTEAALVAAIQAAYKAAQADAASKGK